MKRFLAFLAALLAVAVATGGCNAAVTPPAATVGGSTISASELDAALTNVKGDAGFICTSSGGSSPTSQGTGSDTWSMTFADDVLTQLVKYSVLDSMLAAHHLHAPGSYFKQAKLEVEENVALTLQNLEEGSTPVRCPGTPPSIVNGLGSTFGKRFIDNQLNVDTYSAYLAGTTLRQAALSTWERSHAAIATESCTSAIGFSSKSAATSAKAAIAGGTSFATEAGKSTENIGAGAGGSLGCVPPSAWPPSIAPVVAGLPIGTVSEPVSYNGIYLLFTVTKRQLEPLSQVVGLIDSVEQGAFSSAYAKALADTPIEVSSVYGSFKRTAVQGGYSVSVVPPSDKACSYALSGSAARCS